MLIEMIVYTDKEKLYLKKEIADIQLDLGDKHTILHSNFSEMAKRMIEKIEMK